MFNKIVRIDAVLMVIDIIVIIYRKNEAILILIVGNVIFCIVKNQYLTKVFPDFKKAL